MKEERLAILSMVEKGVISVEEAERLFSAIDKNDICKANGKVSEMFSKAGEGLSSFAKNVTKKTEQMVEDAKPAMKKASDKITEAVEDAKPIMKKAGEKINEAVEDAKPVMKKAADAVAEKAEKFKKKEDLSDFEFSDDEFETKDTDESDFVTEVIVAPLEKVGEKIEEMVEDVQEKVEDVQEKIEEKVEDAKEKIEDFMEDNK